MSGPESFAVLPPTQTDPVLTFQHLLPAVRSATAMAKLLPLLVLLLFAAGRVEAAFEPPKNQPVEITSTGQTNYENGLATARENVAIHIGDTDIYSDYAQYDSHKHEIFVRGN